jgi:hypothetical protein
MLIMPKLQQWICSSLLLVVSVAPVLAGAKDTTDTKTPPEAATGNPAAQPAPAANASPTPVAASGNVTALLGLLVMKGVLAPAEANSIRNAAPEAEFQLLVEALARKGVVNAADLSPAPSPAAAPVAVVVSAPAQTAATTEAKPAAPKVIPAVAPLRVLQLEPSKVDGMIPDIKLGSGARLKLYGMVKTTVIYDTSAPYGTDMPLPGFMTASGTSFDPGPTRSPEFHAKARFARVGTNFEWPDMAGSNTAITGKLEFDFEGNFSRALNRNISSIRSSMASIRLAFGRVDHKINDQTNIFGVFGQDWTPFGSSTLPNLFETTGLGLGFGTLYERAPQFRFGIGHKIGGSRNVFFQPEFAVVMPAYGNDHPTWRINSDTARNRAPTQDVRRCKRGWSCNGNWTVRPEWPRPS